MIAPIPEVGYDVPEALFVAEHTGRDVNNIVAPTLAEYQARNRVVLDVLQPLRSTSDVEVVDIAMRMCDLQRCTVADSGGPWYVDDQHLSTYGSQHLSPFFEGLFTDSVCQPFTRLDASLTAHRLASRFARKRLGCPVELTFRGPPLRSAHYLAAGGRREQTG